MKKNAIAAAVDIATTNATPAADQPHEVEQMERISQLSPEALIKNIPIHGEVDHDRLARVVTQVNAELAANGAVFTDDGHVEGLSRQRFAELVNPIVLAEFKPELSADLKSALLADNSPVKQMAPWLQGEELDTLLNRICDVAIDSNVGLIDDDGELVELIAKEVDKIKPPQEDPEKQAELEEFINAHTKPLEPKNPKPAPVEPQPVQSKTTVEKTVEVDVKAGEVKIEERKTHEYSVGLDESKTHEVKIKATDSSGKEVKVARVEIVSRLIPYTPTFEHKQDVDGEWVAIASPIPAVGKMTDLEIKEMVAKTIVEFRENFNGKQCEWNTKLVFPDDEVDLLGMFTQGEINQLVWGFSEPDLDCWDIQSVQTHLYGLEFTYKEAA